MTAIYDATSELPKEEVYGLTSQIRRSAVSIPSNVSEGAARHSDKEFVQFLYVALGSAAELETQLIIAKRLKYLNDSDELLGNLTSIMKMLSGLIRHYKNKFGISNRRSGTGKGRNDEYGKE